MTVFKIFGNYLRQDDTCLSSTAHKNLILSNLDWYIFLEITAHILPKLFKDIKFPFAILRQEAGHLLVT